MTLLCKYQRCERGTVAIEAVFVLPFLVLIGFGAVDGSLLMMQNHKVENGLASAGNYLAKTQTPTLFEGTAKRLATTGQISSGGDKKVKNWNEGDVSITYIDTANTETETGRSYRGGDTIKVVKLSTNVPFQGLGFLKSVSGGTLTIKASYEERLVAAQS